MRIKTFPAILVALLISGCGDNLPPWLIDTGNPQDTGRDATDTIVHDTAADTLTDVARDVADVRHDAAVDVQPDVTPDTTPTDHGFADAIDVADATADADATHTDVTVDTLDAADASDANDVVTPDISLDFGWECVRDQDCVPPGDLGGCEAMSCVDHACVRGDAPDFSDCNDSNACTSDDMCVDGICSGTEFICNDGNVCTTDYCVPATGCATTAKNNIPCNDGDPCTISDRCGAKVCKGTAMVCDVAPDKACNETFTAVVTWTAPGQCVGGTCEYPHTSTPCPDGCANAECLYDPCSGVVCNNPPGPCFELDGECVGGECVYDPDNTKICTDGNPCTIDTCGGGNCGSVAIICDDPPAKECTGDGLSLTVWSADGTCEGGECAYPESTLPCTGGCVDGICSSDPCLGVDCSVPPGPCYKAPGECVNGTCEWTPDDNLACTDSDECTDGDHCLDGVCVPGTDVECDDNDLCTYDYCDTDAGCVNDDIGDQCDDNNECTNNTCAPLFGCDYPWNNATCDDDNACTINDFCDGGECVPGVDLECDDSNECTDDSCNIETGCVNAPNIIQCRAAECDGLVLKQAAFCANKSCQIPADVNCDDGELCTISTCDAVLGCGSSFSTGTCDDSNACTTNDKCQGGSCGGTLVTCTTPPLDYCLDDDTVVRHKSPGSCSGGNCQYTTSNHDCAFGCDGGACNGDPCEGVVCRNLTNPCKATDGTCSGGVCSYDDVDDVPCDTDSSVCTTETCQGGNCTFAGNLVCDDGNICSDDDCNPVSGCVTGDNTDPCDDGDPCTTGDVCAGQACHGTPMICAVQPDQCHDNGRCEGGTCTSDALTDTDCDLDSSVCTPDRCQLGVCTAAWPVECDLGNVCEDYWCDSALGCQSGFNLDTCDDGDKCTENDSCALGSCQPGTPKDCSDTNICTDTGCEPATGCWITNNSDTCDDNDPCTWSDTCSGGTCSGTAYTCDDLPCAIRTCDGAGECGIAVTPGWCAIDLTCHMEGAPNPENPCETCQPAVTATEWTARTGECSDGDPCTTGDTCVDGTCQTSGTLDCDDSEFCTSDWCLPGTGCMHGNKTDPCDDGEICTVGDTCSGGSCLGSPKDCGETTTCLRNWCENGVGCQSENLEGACDDGDPCTVGDQCSFGSCATLGLMNCTDYQSCTTDHCVDGLCVHDKLANLAPCNDGNPCTNDDKCINGYCGGTGVNCFDDDICTDDTCDLDTLTCEYPYNTNLCDDENACTSGDRCSLGECDGTPIVCDDNDVCTDNGCNPATGCEYPPNNQFCDDGDKCTESDVCAGGDCTPGPQVDCDDHNECTFDHCHPATGCLHDALSQACDDGNLCTYNDFCFNKVCEGIEITCEPVLSCTTAECDGTDQCDEAIVAGWCVIAGACVADEARAPGNPCVFCDADVLPTDWSNDDGIACDDGESCTSADTCSGGNCVGSTYSCDDTLDCTADACRGDGTCDNIPAPGWCAIDNACWSDGSNPAGDVCRVCSPAQNPTGWTFTGVDCEDGDQCTVDDYCGGGTCHAGIPRVCNDNNVCTDDLCEFDRPGGCHHPAITAICAQPFCDGLVYHAPSMCSGTVCPEQETRNCDDGNQCTDDECTATGCVNTPRAGVCNDGDNCTRDDTCNQTSCMGTPYSCPVTDDCVASSACNGDGTCTDTPEDAGVSCGTDGNPCTTDQCDGAGGCAHDPVSDGQPCSDNNLCTSGDTCFDGTCSDGNDVICVALDDCHVAGECNPATGLCSNPLADDGATCDDGNPCTSGDFCTAGECEGPTVNPCMPVDDCHEQGSCNPVTGLCSWPSLPDGTGCDDSNPCTTRDVCSKGECRGLNPKDCSPVDSCHYTGTCNQSTGFCDWPEKPDGTTCDDLNACTTGTSCQDGSCTNGTDKSCPPLNNCHFEGTCNPATGICSQPKKDDGTECTDGNPCSMDDQCVNGTCSGTSFTCFDNRTCTTDTCLGDGQCSFIVNAGACLIDSYCRTEAQTNPANACQVCDHEAAPDAWSPNTGATCTDYRQDTMNDACVGTTCTGTPYDCSDGLDCTEDICDGAGGADHYLQLGWCKIDGVCRANGEADPANACRRCQVSASTISWTPTENGISCNDGQACTYSDKCQSGTCQGTTYSCDDGLDCTDNSCDGDGTCDGSLHEGWCLIWNACVQDASINPVNICQQCTTSSSLTAWSPANEGVACDDGNIDTTDDRCVGGNCIGTGESCTDGLDCTDDIRSGGACLNPVLPDWCLIDGVCAWNGDTNQANRCQICNPTLSQTDWSSNNGVPCSDGDACTQDDTCLNQVCGGAQIDCDDGIACTTDMCEAGLCTSPIDTGWCLISGVCVESGAINPANVCDICDPARLKLNWSSNDGVYCDDQNICSSGDTCVSRVCRGSSYFCDDGIACTVETCDGQGGCDIDVLTGWCLIDGNCVQEGETNVWNSCRVCDSMIDPRAWSDNADAPCDDGNQCTWPDNCDGSTCAGTAAPCEDGLVCTTQACDGTGGCGVAVLDPGWCLIDGNCVADRTVNQVNACLICKSAIDPDAWSFRDGVACDDGAACTVFDSCMEGTCSGTSYVCDDHPWCIEEDCDGLGGCLVSGVVPGDCLIGNQCHAGDEINPANDCEACVGTQNAYSWSPLSGTACDDEIACTSGDTCAAGTCGGTVYPCDDGVECTDNICDGAGGCSHPIAAGWCRIEGGCWLEGTPHPTLDCTVCAPTVNPGDWTHQDNNADEVCNGVDDNCDGNTDPENAPGCEFLYVDHDRDGIGTGAASRCLCAPEGDWASIDWGDCDDADPDAFPGNNESCDTADNDCDGATDETGSVGCVEYFYDSDGDGFGQPGTQTCMCGPDGLYDALEGGDCNDASTAVNPDIDDICNGIDDDCDGITDPDGAVGCVNTYRDEDLDGYGAEPPICMCTPRGAYTVLTGGDCNDLTGAINPAATDVCNKVDEDCDGTTDNAPIEDACPLLDGFEAHGQMICTAGKCQIDCQDGQEDPPLRSWHDLDGDFASGCECEADAVEHLGGGECSTAISLGVVPDDGTVLDVQGNLPMAGGVDWYIVNMSDATWNAEPGNADAFHAKVQLSDAALGEFEIAVTEGSCSNDPACGSASMYEWAVNFWTATLGENPCSVMGNYCPDGNPTDYAECLAITGDPERCNSCPAVASPDHHACIDNTRNLLIRVSRHDGLPASCNSYSLTISNGL